MVLAETGDGEGSFVRMIELKRSIERVVVTAKKRLADFFCAQQCVSKHELNKR